MSLNVWNYQGEWPRRREMIADLIETYRPDVVALQETRHDPRYEGGRGQGEQIADLLGYHLTTSVAHVYLPFPRVDEGLSLLTREPPLRVLERRLTHARLLTRMVNSTFRGDGNQRICLGVAVQRDERAVHVFDTHFSLNPAARLRNAIETMLLIREASDGAPAVLMGDLNADPGDPPMRYLCGQLAIEGTSGDFIDCWTAVHPDEPGYTDESWNPRRRIDYVLARNLVSRPVRAELLGREPEGGVYMSDHLAVLVEFGEL
jgi:endonuclease/exonuclease/phosphatase family metal-dependent hydrolase